MIKRLLFITLFLFSGLVQAQESQRIDVPKRFVNQKSGTFESLPLLSTYGGVGAGSSTSVVAAVTGKRIRVMGGIFMSDSTTNIGSVVLRNASGAGTVLSAFGTTALTGGLGPVILPITESGYFETATSAALFIAAVTHPQQWTIFYVIYTP